MRESHHNSPKAHLAMLLRQRYCRWAQSVALFPWTASRKADPGAPGNHGRGIYLVVFLIPATALCIPSSPPSSYEPPRSRPYLLVAGAPTLRFREAIVPQPDLSTHPPAGAPPIPQNREFSSATAAPRAIAAPTSSAAISSATAAQPAGGTKTAPSPDTNPPPPPIIPDDSKPKVRPEDFLPYFQFPGSKPNPEDVTSVPEPPKPGMQTPSTATYHQQ